MIKIIVDSTCDLPKSLLEEYDIKKLPLRILLHNEDYADGVDITIDEVYDEMRKDVLPKTSQVRPADFYNLFKECLEKGDDFIYLAFSRVLSGTCNVAEMIINELKEQYPDRKMAVIDSKAGALGNGIIAVQGAMMNKDEKDFEYIKSQMEFMVEHLEYVFTLDDLNWLTKGGRINKFTGAIGGMLDIKPILNLDDGYMKVIKTSRGRKKSLSTLMNILDERMKDFKSQTIGISHADDLDIAEDLKIKLSEKYPDCNFIIMRIGSVLGAHLGIAGVGLFCLNEKPEFYEKVY